MTYSAYPEMKPSSVEWLGDVPSHWGVCGAKHAYSIQLGKMLQPKPEEDDVLVPYLKALHVQWSGMNTDDLPLMWSSPYELKNYSVEDGDLLVCEGGEVGRAAIATGLPQPCIIQNSLHRVRSRKNKTKFFMYVLRATAAADWFNVLCNKATIAHLTGEKLGALGVPIPPLPEQQQISAFLDRKTAEIDHIIGLKERQIALLAEQRQALISRAVTRGLDPNVPLKPSGIEWLGNVPAHWTMSALKWYTKRLQTGSTPPTSMQQYYEDGEVPWFGSSSFGTDLTLVNPVKMISADAIRDGVARIFDSGSTLVVTIGSIGKTGYLEEAGSCNQQITGITFDASRIFSKYGAYQFKVLEPVMVGIAPNTTLPILDQDEVGGLKICVPPLLEQQAIVNYLDRETANMDGLGKTIEAQIGTLREWRQALISAAVTGKIDVRGS